MFARCCFLLIFFPCLWPHSAVAQSRQAPPGVFKDLNDAIVGDALILHGKQLFIDDYVIADLKDVKRVLNQPKKHPKNPLLVRDRPWEESGPGYGTVHYDSDAKLYKMWYTFWRKVEGTSTSLMCYATSPDGIAWTKPIIDKRSGANVLRHPPIQGFQCPGVFKDPVERDPARRYKMLFSCNPDGTAKTWMTSAAYSADGLHWEPIEPTSLIPFSDTQVCPFWDRRRQRYVAILRFGPPNTRIISRTESDDFLHWSPKVTVLRRTPMDAPLATQFYQMAPFPYGDVYFGLIAAYHSETLKPIPPDKLWTDRKNLQLTFSRNGVTWQRVGKRGVIPASELQRDRDWRRVAEDAVFLPFGEKDKEWDWGTVSPYFTPEPIIVGDEIWFYYVAQNGRNWWNYTGDPPQKDPRAKEPRKGVGLATLRLDGFVSVETKTEGTLTTKPLVFLGDTLLINADARGGSLVVEALDPDDKPIKGFTRSECEPVSSDSVRHIVAWRGQRDCRLLQGRPIKLRFYLQNAKMFSFEPTTRHNHYLQSYE